MRGTHVKTAVTADQREPTIISSLAICVLTHKATKITRAQIPFLYGPLLIGDKVQTKEAILPSRVR